MRTKNTCSILEKSSGVKELFESHLLQKLLTAETEISSIERQTRFNLCRKLKLNVQDWNEVELVYSFIIGTVLALVDYTT